MEKYNFNYHAIPVLAIGFTRSTGIFSRLIQFFRGGLRDENFPNHTFFVVDFYGQKFAAEETLKGFKMSSLEEYTYPDNKIIGMFYWTGWDDESKRAAALKRIAYILREQGNKTTRLGKYDFWGLLSFIPVLKWFIKKDPEAEWCSEDVAAILKNQGQCPWVGDIHLAPDQLFGEVKSAEDCLSFQSYI